MSTNTYVELRTETVATATPSVTFSLSGISGYNDLVISSSVQNTTAASTIAARYNGDTGSNYSFTYLIGDGSSSISGRAANQTFAVHGYANTTQFATNVTQINNYSNNTTFKTTLDRRGTIAQFVGATVSCWRNTAAITSITIYNENGANFAVGSTFSLYGIAVEGVGPAAKATGGTIYSDSTHYYHVFGAGGTFTPLSSFNADVLVVAGGGGGGSAAGGGGGAGGLLTQTARSCSSGTPYTVIVGAGGAGAISDGQNGSPGANSVFDTITALGGGYGAHNTTGGTGGSGGGGGYNPNTGGATTQGNSGGATGYGFAGGGNTSPGGLPYAAGGGGGAGAIGGTGNTSQGGNGGNGRTEAFFNAIGLATGAGETVSGLTYFAGGGGGSRETVWGTGGLGGGGKGGSVISASTDSKPLAGRVNTGGGAGGGNKDGFYNGPSNNVGMPGGSGVVIVRYAKV